MGRMKALSLLVIAWAARPFCDTWRKPPSQVGKAILIATPISQLKGEHDFSPIENFFNPELDWQKIRQNCQEFIIFNQINDSWVPLQHGKDLSFRLNGKLETVNGANHFDTIDFQLLEKYILN